MEYALQTPDKKEYCKEYYDWYLTKTMSEPVLSVNGNFGTDEWAVSAVSFNSAWDAYNATNASTNTPWHSEEGNSPFNYYVYSKTPFKLTTVNFTNRADDTQNVYPVSSVTIYGSNNNSTYTSLGTFSNNVTAANASWSVTVNANTAYSYYKIEFTTSSSYCAMKYIHLNGQPVTTLVSGNTRTYTGNYTYKLLNHVETGSSNDYDAIKNTKRTFMLKRPNTTEYYKEYYNWYLHKYKMRNYVVKGSLTLNGSVLTGFNATNYADIDNIPFNTANTFEIGASFNSASVSEQQIIYTEATTSYYSWIGLVNSKLYTAITVNHTSSLYLTGKTTLENSKRYWVKVEFTGSVYNLYLSTDGINYALENTISSTVKMPLTRWFIGYCPNAGTPRRFIGNIYTADCYIKLNGSVWWQGIKENSTNELPWRQPLLLGDANTDGNISGYNIIATNQSAYYVKSSGQQERFWHAFNDTDNQQWQINSVDPALYSWGTFTVDIPIKIKSIDILVGSYYPSEIKVYGYLPEDTSHANAKLLGTLSNITTGNTWYKFTPTSNTTSYFKHIQMNFKPSSSVALQINRILINAVRVSDFQEDDRVAANTRSYSGNYTYKVLSNLVKSSSSDYDSNRIEQHNYLLKK